MLLLLLMEIVICCYYLFHTISGCTGTKMYICLHVVYITLNDAFMPMMYLTTYVDASDYRHCVLGGITPVLTCKRIAQAIF